VPLSKTDFFSSLSSPTLISKSKSKSKSNSNSKKQQQKQTQKQMQKQKQKQMQMRGFFAPLRMTKWNDKVE
jgi:hypothetical protein